jgi:TolB-like protein/DNA-binding winged helix-turn-helix (wHTH) protein
VEYYCFADLTLDPERRELRRGSTPIVVQPQVFDLLLYLVRNRDRVVSRDDLIASVWGGRIVSESALASRINAVRKAVGDSGQSQALIRTFPRKGVRFIGAVREQSAVHDPARAGGSALNELTGPPAPLPAVDGRARRSKARKLGWVLAGVTATVALALFEFALPSGTANGQRTAVEGNEAIPAATVAVAVLPFANLSSDPEQEFFSDGMTDEITSALAKVRDLRVVGRSSAFQFKGQNRDLRAVGQSLGATHLIEGSVRKVGDQVRITVQLVQAVNGLHVWSETYERNVTDIFSIQEQIASAIAASLRRPLGLREGDGLVRNRTADLDSYELYLRAKAHLRAYRSRPGDPVSMLEQVVARDPGYAPAWALLAVAYTSGLFNVSSSFEIPIQESRRIVNTVLSQAEAAARRAIEVDSGLADGYASLAYIQNRRGRQLAAEDLYLKALTLDRDNPETLHNYASLLAGVGRLKEAVVMNQRLLALEPFVPVYNQIAAWVLWASGQTDAAITIFQAMNPIDRGPLLAGVYASLGRYSAAVNELASRNPNSGTASVLRMAPAKAATPERLPRLDLTAFAYLYVGASDRFLEPIERQVEAGYVDSHRNVEVWHPSPSYAAVRKTERFRAFARKAGLVEYWRAKGWPELCHPVGNDDFVCD